jgi:hypothetical protein
MGARTPVTKSVKSTQLSFDELPNSIEALIGLNERSAAAAYPL